MRCALLTIILIAGLSCHRTSSIGTDVNSVAMTKLPSLSWTEEFLALVNQHRLTLGLRELILDPDLVRIAQTHSEDMASGATPFGHSGFSDRCAEARIVLGGANLCSENVAQGQSSPQKVFDAWMKSTGHRLNIEQPRATHTGFGFKKSATGTYYWTELFLELN